jgi:predicted ABC-type transport system involved in lysophospholipase L1 biosynthesis ATPase subunit
MVASLLTELQQEQATTLIVVTHSADFARRLPRRFELVEGRLEERT